MKATNKKKGLFSFYLHNMNKKRGLFQLQWTHVSINPIHTGLFVWCSTGGGGRVLPTTCNSAARKIGIKSIMTSL